MKTLSPTSIRDLQQCPRLYYYRHVEGLRPATDSPALYAGKAFHEALHVWRTVEKKAEAAALHAFDSSFLSVNRSLLDQDQLTKLDTKKIKYRWALGAYMARYEDEKKAGAYVHSELEMYRDDLKGIADAVVYEKATDLHWILETKTSSFQPTSELIQYLPLDVQVCAYAYLGKTRFKAGTFGGVIYDMVIETQLRQGAKEHITTFQDRVKREYESNHLLLHRIRIPLEQIRVEDFHISLLESLDRIQKSATGEDVGAAYPKHTSNCRGMYSYCPFLDACATGTINPALYKKRE